MRKLFYLALLLLLSGPALAQNQRDVTVVPDNTRFGARFKPEIRTTDRTFDPSGIGSIWFNRTSNKWRGNNNTTIVDLGSGSSSNVPTFACNSSADKILWNNSIQQWVCGADLGSGTVTSFSAGDLSPLFTTTETNPTTTPALTFSLNTQSANTIFAGPTTGSAAAPTFRLLVAADIPSLSSIYQPLDADLTAIGGLAKTDNNLIVANGTTWILTQLPSCSNATNDKLLYNTTTRLFTCGTDQTSGGGSGITSLNGLTGATQTFANDTNVTIVSSGTAHTLTWAGTLAAGRLNSNVVQAITNDTNVTGSISSQNLTLGWTGTLAASRGGTGLSALGTGIATWLGTPSSANLRLALTDESGTGAAYFQGGDIGTPSAGIATNITGLPLTTGVAGTLPIANGGTNGTTSQAAINNLSQLTTNGDILYHNGTNSTRLARGANGECLTSNATTIVWGSCAGAAGDFTDVNGTTNEIDSSAPTGPATTLSLSPTLNLSTKVLQGGTPLVFEGATADAFETSIVVTDPTANRTLTIPNADSVTVQPDTGSSNNFLTAISSIGVISKAQPSFSNLSSTASDAQIPDLNTLSTGLTASRCVRTDTGPNLASATEDCITSSSTNTFTNKTYDAEGTGNTFTMPFTLWLPLAGCNGTTAGTIWDLPSSSPMVPTCTVGTNTVQGYGAFADSSNLSGQYNWAIPSDWTGSIDARFKWFTSATSGDVVWQLATSCVSDAETNDPSFNTASTVTDTAKGTTLQLNDASITGLTTTGCAAGELMHLKISRDASHGSDNLAATANLIGVELKYRRAM